MNDWSVVELLTEIHLIPNDDLRPHWLNPECWCKPAHEMQAKRTYSHNSMDRREEYEKDRPNRRLPS